MIHIGRAGTKLGSFSEFEVRQGLASGRFFLTDLGWKEGMENWTPLSRFSEFEPPPPLPPLPDETDLGEAAHPPQSGGEPGLPWDYRKQIGFIAAFLQTSRMVLFSPAEAFTRMLDTGSLTGPLLYNLIGGWFGAVVSGVYLVFTSRMQEPPANLTGIRALFYLSPANAVREMWFLIILGPIIVTLGTLLGSAVAHLSLKLAGGAKKPYHVTLRVFCFSYGSSQLLQFIPIFGSLFAPIWMLVGCIVGLTAAHRTTTGRSVTAMVLLLAAFFAFFVGAILLAVTAGSIGPALHP